MAENEGLTFMFSSKNKTSYLRALSFIAALSIAPATSAHALDPGYRLVDAKNTIVVDTTKGRIIFEMNPLMAPNHVERILKLTRDHFYDGLTFHRVIEGFMDQTGDPLGNGQGGSTLPNLDAEFETRRGVDFPLQVVSKRTGAVLGFVGSLPVQSGPDELMAITKDAKVPIWPLYCGGTVGMARNNDPNSANSQFFLMRDPDASLEKMWTAFGMVVSGFDIVRKIKIGSPAVDPDKMLKVQVLADMPEKSRPHLEILDTSSAEFNKLAKDIGTSKGANFSMCDIPLSAKEFKD